MARSPVEPPRGLARLRWLGPGFLWMVSAAGSGELLFTPRIGALYGYTLWWAMIGAVACKWCINREIGRWAVVTGTPFIEGLARLPGPGRWAVWLMLAPQLVVAGAAIAGLAGSAATALVLALPGDVRIWMGVALLGSTALVLFGRYRVVEKVATLIGVALALAAVVAAVAVGPPVGEMARGLVPAVARDVDLSEVLPWLGFMLSGAAGMMWYSHWVVAKGYGAASGERSERRLAGWVRQMTFDNTVAVAGTFVIAAAFLVLGAELLRPRGLVPDENRVAEVLGHLLGGVFGPVGYWFMIVAVFVGFWDTVLSDQDGHSRLFARGTRLLRGNRGPDEERLRQAFVVGLVTVVPLGLFLVLGQPVALLKLAGAVEAVHIPVVTFLVLWLNRGLPRALRPGPAAVAVTAVAGLFFVVFAGYYLLRLVLGG